METSRNNRMLDIACAIYNREHRGTVTPSTFSYLHPSVASILLDKAEEILVEMERYQKQIEQDSPQTAQEDEQFLQDHPVNGDIDLSPYPLL